MPYPTQTDADLVGLHEANLRNADADIALLEGRLREARWRREEALAKLTEASLARSFGYHAEVGLDGVLTGRWTR